MNTDDKDLNSNAKEVVKEFVINKMISLLPDPECLQKIKDDNEIFPKLAIRLVPKDLLPIVVAIRESSLIDDENRQIKDGQRVMDHLTILNDLFVDTNMLSYYKEFSKVKLDTFNYSDFQYVSAALKIFDCTNWDNDTPNTQTQVEVRNFYLHTILNTNVSGDDKIYNLNVLQDDLKIALSEEEKAQISTDLKQNIMKLVDLIDQMRKTSFGAKPLPPGKPSDRQTEEKEETPPVVEKDEIIGDSKKKPRRGLFGRK